MLGRFKIKSRKAMRSKGLAPVLYLPRCECFRSDAAARLHFTVHLLWSWKPRPRQKSASWLDEKKKRGRRLDVESGDEAPRCRQLQLDRQAEINVFMRLRDFGRLFYELEHRKPFDTVAGTMLLAAAAAFICLHCPGFCCCHCCPFCPYLCLSCLSGTATVSPMRSGIKEVNVRRMNE